MIEALLIILASMLGVQLTDLKSQNPADFQQYDQAKEIYLDQQKVKDGGIGTEQLGG